MEHNKFYKKLPNGDMVEMSTLQYMAFSGIDFGIPFILFFPLVICGLIILFDAYL